MTWREVAVSILFALVPFGMWLLFIRWALKQRGRK